MRISRRQFAVTSMGLAGLLERGAAAASPAVRDAVEDSYVPASASGQRVEGILGERIRVNIEERLLKGVDIDALLAAYRRRPGKQTWIGEHAAKFIDAATNLWVYSGHERLKAKLDSAVCGLLETQEADGYLGTYLPANRWKDWDLWAHKYNLIALLNYYSRTGYEPSLQACRRIGDLVAEVYGPGRRSIVLNDWHVGMANTSILEPMVSLYRWTGNPKYLDFCRYIVRAWDEEKGPRIVRTLLETGSVRRVANGKAYEMTSNLVGLLDLHRITGEKEYLEPVEIAWRDIVANRLYVSGTASWDELFRENGFLRADDKDAEAGVGEGCVTTTWMQMNLHLLRLTGDCKYADQLERTAYNALIAAQHPATGLICYFVPLEGIKRYGAVSHGIPGVSCCASSVPRGISLLPQIAWGGKDGMPALNLYAPGTAVLPCKSGNLELSIRTRFPAAGGVEIAITSAPLANVAVWLRVPEWCDSFRAEAGGKVTSGKPGTYAKVERVWRPGEVLRVEMGLGPRVISGSPAYPDKVAVQLGPQVLAADAAWNRDAELWMNSIGAQPSLAPAKGAPPRGWKGNQAYATDGFEGNAVIGTKKRTLVLVPLADAGQTNGEYRVWLKKL